jgi:hypothetical protein
LIERVNRKNGSHFLSCERWPACEFTTAIPASVEMRRAGAALLPGFE